MARTNAAGGASPTLCFVGGCEEASVSKDGNHTKTVSEPAQIPMTRECDILCSDASRAEADPPVHVTQVSCRSESIFRKENNHDLKLLKQVILVVCVLVLTNATATCASGVHVPS